MYVRGMCRYALDGHAVVVAVLALVLAVRESCGGIDDRMLWRVGSVVYRIVDADLAEPFGSVMTLRVRMIGERGGLYVYVVVNFEK